MVALKVGYVPEHFSSPLLQLAKNCSWLTLVPCPSGTGQMISALNDRTVDVAIALTESLISGIANKKGDYKLVGEYVSTPLNWAVVTGSKSKYNSIDDLRNTKIGISRIGSGSQVMASYMALKHEWFSDVAAKKVEPIDFKVCDTFQNLRDNVNSGEASCFMWEWYTTKPYKDSGEVRYIGNVPTPWPSWVIVKTPEADNETVKDFLNQLSEYVRKFDSKESRSGPNVDFIKQEFGYQEEDIRAWLETVGYPQDVGTLDHKLVLDTLGVLENAGVVNAPEGGWNIEDFVDTKVSKKPQ